jgi:hypothetical protein
MNKSVLLVVSLLVIMATLQSAIARFSLGCTLSCGMWNMCRFEGIQSGNLNNCGSQPSGCDCTHFSWERWSPQTI